MHFSLHVQGKGMLWSQPWVVYSTYLTWVSDSLEHIVLLCYSLLVCYLRLCLLIFYHQVITFDPHWSSCGLLSCCLSHFGFWFQMESSNHGLWHLYSSRLFYIVNVLPIFKPFSWSFIICLQMQSTKGNFWCSSVTFTLGWNHASQLTSTFSDEGVAS